MLILQRYEGQTIVIPTPLGPIRITPIEIGQVRGHGRGMVRLGIEAPPEVDIFREEVAQRGQEVCRSVWGRMPIGQTGGGQ
jgi:carbon storage regulator CsrA